MLPAATMQVSAPGRPRILPQENPVRRPAAALPGRPPAASADQLSLAPGALTLNRLLRTWQTLGRLLGAPAGRPNPVADLLALREALREAQLRLQEMRERHGVLHMLRTSALRGAEELVAQYYGLLGDGARLQVVLEPDMGGALAAVSYRYDHQGRMTNQHLHLNLTAFTPDTGPNGRNGRPIENDRIIAHELTHAVMGRHLDIRALPEWFMEGTAELIAGGAERVAGVLRHLTPRQLLAQLRLPWRGDSPQYAAAYLAARYLHEIAAPVGGMQAVLAELKAGFSLDQAIERVTEGRYAGEAAFLSAFTSEGEGMAFLPQIDLTGRDPGSIRPGRGPDIVPDGPYRNGRPLRGFEVVWPSPVPDGAWRVVVAYRRSRQPVGLPIRFWAG